MSLKRLALVTDAWRPQTNGVVNTLVRLVKHLEARGTEVLVISPDGHRTMPLPSYPEIKVALNPWKAVKRIRAFAPHAVHVATEGPLVGTQTLENGSPGCLAATDVEHRANGPGQKKLGDGNGHFDLSGQARRGADAVTFVAVPALEIRLIVQLHVMLPESASLRPIAEGTRVTICDHSGGTPRLTPA